MLDEYVMGLQKASSFHIKAPKQSNYSTTFLPTIKQNNGKSEKEKLKLSLFDKPSSTTDLTKDKEKSEKNEGEKNEKNERDERIYTLPYEKNKSKPLSYNLRKKLYK